MLPNGGMRTTSPRLMCLAGAVCAAAAVTGLMAAVAPFLVIVIPIGVLFVLVAARNLAAGVVLFTILLFFQEIPGLPTTGITGVKMGGYGPCLHLGHDAAR